MFDDRAIGQTFNARWRESSLFSEREHAALGWTGALTRVADIGAPEEDYAALA